MANVEGWEVGTFHGNPIYKTVPKEKFMDPVIQDYFAHGPSESYVDSALFSFYT